MNKKILVGSLVAAVVLIGGVSISWAANNNYTDFREFMNKRAPQVTEKNFDQFTDMQQKMINGDYEAAQQIKTELGLGQRQGNNKACGMRNNQRGDHKNGSQKGCSIANEGGSGFVDANDNGVCDFRENLK